MTSPLSVSSDPFGTRIVLARTMRGLDEVRYVEVARAGSDQTVLAPLDAHGWSGTRVEPASASGALAATADLHLLVLDTGGSDDAVLRSALEAGTRPWLVVAPATVGLPAQVAAGWEGFLESAGYERGLFDGRSAYYLAPEHAEALRPALALATTTADAPDPDADFPDDVRAELHRLRSANAELARANGALVRELVRWRSRAIERWADVASRPIEGNAESLRDELDALRSTLSWRVTRPLRAVRWRPPRRSTPPPKDSASS